MLGVRSYARVSDVPEPIDPALVLTPASTTPAIISECINAGVRGTVIISAGFKEVGFDEAKLGQSILPRERLARRHMTGLNCLGVM